MANTYKQVSNFGTETHFSQAVTGELAFSRMLSTPTHLTTFNAGDIVPIYCLEVLPHDTFEIDIDAIIRQTTLLTPTMGKMTADFYAFFVPNRVVNQSFKSVMGENVNGSWTASSVSLAPLVGSGSGFPTSYTVPVGSVADYYGFPTQAAIPSAILQQCHDLKFRGYVEIYNEFFRDQNYQPPIPYSKLNVFEGFFDYSPSGRFKVDGTYLYSEDLGGPNLSTSVSSTSNDNSVGAGALGQAIFGNLERNEAFSVSSVLRSSVFNALGKPLKANKLHDYFTSVLPSSQKSPSSVLVPVTIAGSFPVTTSATDIVTGTAPTLRWRTTSGIPGQGAAALSANFQSTTGQATSTTVEGGSGSVGTYSVFPSNLQTQVDAIAGSLTISDIRLAAAVQQIYETLAVGGSRYKEFVRSFFALEVDDPFKDIPSYLGHVRRDLDLYQTAQTSASETGGTAQGNLAAFGYTATGGKLFKETFLEHGYIHVLCVVRHRNVYSSYLAPDNFRQNMLDFYTPQLANISEQPVYTKYINPFNSNTSQVFGYQEAWAEYRYDPDYVSGYMRPGVTGSLALWNYADDFNSSLTIATGDWLQSNSEEVLNRTLATTSAIAPQLKGQFTLRIDKERPMPTYSIPGLDIV